MNIKKIIISGDSFVHGFDLCFEMFGLHPFMNWTDAFRNFTPEQKTIFEDTRLSGQLKKHFNCEIVDLSWPGESNDFIANSLISYVAENKKTIDPETTLIIAGWSEAERFPFYLNNGVLNICFSIVNHYIKHTEREHPQTIWSKQRIENYKAFLGMQELWEKNETMTYTGYFHHTSLITLLQTYLEQAGLKYCFFNSLKIWPLKPNYDRLHKMKDYSDTIINWKNWYPYRNRDSYYWNWDETLRLTEREKNKLEAEGKPTHVNTRLQTATNHPNIISVETHGKYLSEFIKNHY